MPTPYKHTKAPAPQPASALAAVREPLSDEQIDALAMDERGLPNSHLEFARAIERWYGIGITAQAQQEGGR